MRKFPLSFGKSMIASKVNIDDEDIYYTNSLGVKFHLVLNQYLMRNIYLYDIPEYNTFRQIKRIYDPSVNGAIIDCGANIGLYSLNLAKLYPSKDIHAFEPLAYNMELLKENVHLNDFEKITLNKNAVSDETGRLMLKYGDKKSGASLFVDEYNKGGTEEVDVITLDDYCDENNISAISLLKIDVEGAEKRVLDGAKRVLLKSNNCILVVELIDQHLKAAGSSAKDVYSTICDLGFVAYLPKAWPSNLKKVASFDEIPENYMDNVLFIKRP